MAELSAEAALPQPLEALIAAQRPGWTLERVFYTHPAIFQLDLERVFFRHWLFAGVLGSIPRPGDYFLYAIGAESIVVMRGDGGAADGCAGRAPRQPGRRGSLSELLV